MSLRNTQSRFGTIAISFHWLIALLFIGMIGLGLTMTNLPLANPWTFPLFQWHKSFGMLILALVVLRLIWRQTQPLPAAPPLRPYEKAAMHLTHYGLYAALFLMPLTGWVVVSSSSLGLPTILFKTIHLPHIGFIAASPHKALINEWASEAHEVIAWTASALVVGHVAAALYHHVIRKDDILRRMLPERRRKASDKETP
ncbi:MAG: cytochrome b [Rhizobiales bacterium]|nr:cytochrome b [Hyphomicrobiales bacterium]